MAAAQVKGYSLLLRNRPILPPPSPSRHPPAHPGGFLFDATGKKLSECPGHSLRVCGGAGGRIGKDDRRRERRQTVKLARLARRGVNHDFRGILARDGMRFPPVLRCSSPRFPPPSTPPSDVPLASCPVSLYLSLATITFLRTFPWRSPALPPLPPSFSILCSRRHRRLPGKQRWGGKPKLESNPNSRSARAFRCFDPRRSHQRSLFHS